MELYQKKAASVSMFDGRIHFLDDQVPQKKCWSTSNMERLRHLKRYIRLVESRHGRNVRLRRRFNTLLVGGGGIYEYLNLEALYADLSDSEIDIGTEYSMSGLGGGFRINVSAEPQLAALLLDVVNLRHMQPVLDPLLRDLGETVCVPHVGSQRIQLPPTPPTAPRPMDYGKKLGIVGKIKFTYVEAICYTLMRCFVVGHYTGALLPVGVDAANAPGHQNMTYFHCNRAARTIHCYLFDPNGTDSPPGKDAVAAVWGAVVAWWEKELTSNPAIPGASLQVVAGVQLLGGYGVQTRLGLKMKWQEGNRTFTSYRGDPICGAITYWMFTQWVRHVNRYPAYDTFEQHILETIDGSEENRLIYQRQVHAFVAGYRKEVEATYEAKLRTILDEDMLQVGQHLPTPSLPVTVDVTHENPLLAFHNTYTLHAPADPEAVPVAAAPGW